MYKISFIGAGNVTYRLSLALQKAGHNICCICNRDTQKAEKVVRALKREKNKLLIQRNYVTTKED